MELPSRDHPVVQNFEMTHRFFLENLCTAGVKCHSV